MKYIKKKIKQISKVIGTGTTPPTKENDFFDGDINWFTPGDLNNVKFVNSSIRKLSDLAIIKKKVKIFPKNTVIISCIGEIGKVGILGNKSTFNQQITGVILDEEVILPELFYYWVVANKELLKYKAAHAIIPILNNSNLQDINVVFPKSIKDQKQLILQFDYVYKFLKFKQQTIDTLDQLVKSVFLSMFGDPYLNEKGWQKTKFGNIITLSQTALQKKQMLKK